MKPTMEQIKEIEELLEKSIDERDIASITETSVFHVRKIAVNKKCQCGTRIGNNHSQCTICRNIDKNKEILDLIPSGLSAKEIAETTGCSVRVVWNLAQRKRVECRLSQ